MVLTRSFQRCIWLPLATATCKRDPGGSKTTLGADLLSKSCAKAIWCCASQHLCHCVFFVVRNALECESTSSPLGVSPGRRVEMGFRRRRRMSVRAVGIPSSSLPCPAGCLNLVTRSKNRRHFHRIRNNTLKHSCASACFARNMLRECMFCQKSGPCT